MDLEQKFKKETGFDAYIENDLQPKIPMGYYVEWLEERLKLTGVSNTEGKVFCEDRNEYCTDDVDGLCRDCWISKNPIDLTK